MDKFVTILDFFISRLKKKLAVFERLFWQLGTRISVAGCRELAVVEKFK